MTITPVAKADALVKAYGTHTVVKGVSFCVNPGEIVVLVGPNGSGKTTTMEMLIGLRRPTGGRAIIGGVAVRPGGAHRHLVGVQLQQAGLPNRLRTGEALQAVASLYADPEDPRELLERVGLGHAWKTPIDRLSGGQQRRLDIAIACIGKPPFLLLDEPTSGMDPEGRAQLWELLRATSSPSCGVLASTHDLGEAEAFADRVLMMRDGTLVLDGAVDTVVTRIGGEWRLRVPFASAVTAATIESSPLRSIRSGSTVVAIGSREEIEGLRDTIVSDACADDVIVGPVRLEDVFLFAREQEAA
ncbi:ABC transporter ATP-binding protein [Microbacterium lacticum]|uniref:ABC transporter ATP-binding protein n=1 Tax=Microbacterium lacticum TaxID=33885 RepID=UPI003A87A73D